MFNWEQSSQVSRIKLESHAFWFNLMLIESADKRQKLSGKSQQFATVPNCIQHKQINIQFYFAQKKQRHLIRWNKRQSSYKTSNRWYRIPPWRAPIILYRRSKYAWFKIKQMSAFLAIREVPSALAQQTNSLWKTTNLRALWEGGGGDIC